MELRLFEALNEITARRISTRAFSNREIPDHLIEKILQVAEKSPYASGRKNWGIEVVKERLVIDQAAKAVSDKATKMESAVRESYRNDFAGYADSFSCFRSAPVLLIPNYRISPSFSAIINAPDTSLQVWERDNFVKSISCVVMMVLLAAESLGLGACCVTGALIAEEELIKIIKIKTGRHIGAIVPVGYKKTED